MTPLRATTIEELCHTLGLRTPIGVITELQTAPTEPSDVSRFTDEQLTALGVLAAPEAIAVVTQWPVLQPFSPALPVVHVIATRGPWLAEHVIEGEAHHLHATDSDNAAALLLDRCDFLGDGAHVARRTEVINVTLHAYRRMTELAKAGDTRRACAALVADGATPAAADSLIDAVKAGRIEVAGLGSDGRRFVGCDVAVAGDDRTGRWSVPSTQHVDALPKHAFRHPSFGTSGNLRVIIEPVTTQILRDELALIFGTA